MKKHEIAVKWLGQAGFLIKDHRGYSIAVDPYLTDSCERLVGFKRLTPSPVKPSQLKADLIIATHHHEDHLDMDAVPEMMDGTMAKLAGSQTAVKICMDAGIDRERLISLKSGESVNIDSIGIKAVFADHGDMAPDALGILLDISGIRIYITGDTGYTPDKMQDAIKSNPDILILPINGAYGNLDSAGAARLAGDTNAEIVIPCHFWTFKEHGGNPQEFAEMMENNGMGDRVRFLMQGEIFFFNSGRHEKACLNS